MKPPQQGVAIEVVTQRQRRHAVLDVQLPRRTGEMPVAQAVERLAETGGGKDLRAADQTLSGQIFQHEEIILRAMTLNVFFE